MAITNLKVNCSIRVHFCLRFLISRFFLTGEIPVSLGNCVNLTKLFLNQNKLKGKCIIRVPPYRTRRTCDLHLHFRRFLFSRISVPFSIWFEIAQRRFVVPQSLIQLHYVSSYSNPSPPDQDSRGCVGTSSPSPLRSYSIPYNSIP